MLNVQKREVGEPSLIEGAGKAAYKEAGIGPEDIDVFEIHDAAASSELMTYEELGLCEHGNAAKLIVDKLTYLDGSKPVNTSGGLEAKGHPVGATGIGQICELVFQLRGEAGPRQIKGAKVALAENAGGFLGRENAASAITILKR
ncbi:thiolase family protein [Alkalihalobacterium alkalinitrilicum]|uniref:thiolase family protein n=1 Tax=Alkalihalobacterium alkalinitrilicum TaxID=427920 RepID=UPI001C58D794|nr:thiolase family protein [Alkalihalobacterium alkalinitrilicum]